MNSSTTTAPVVLVIDDDRRVRSGLRRLLGGAGFDMREADGGRAGLRALDAETPAAVVLDLLMPDMNGRDVLRMIRSSCPDLPVVIYSGTLDDGLCAALKAEGASAIVAKGCDVANLLATLRRLVASRWS